MGAARQQEHLAPPWPGHLARDQVLGRCGPPGVHLAGRAGPRRPGGGQPPPGDRMTSADIAAWESFAVALAGVCAVLAGLVFLAVSINIERILRVPGLAGRAGGSTVPFLRCG